MKTLRAVAVVTAALAQISVLSQLSKPSASADVKSPISAKPDRQPDALEDIGPHHRVVHHPQLIEERIAVDKLPAGGFPDGPAELGKMVEGEVLVTRVQTNRFVELASGLHYWVEDEHDKNSGHWRESKAVIELDAKGGGAVAREGQHRVRFSPNLHGGVDLRAPDDQRFRSRLLGLAYFDPITGESVLIAEINPRTTGQLLPPNQVLYADAFAGEGITADVRYTYTIGGLEQDVIVLSQLPEPEALGFPAESAAAVRLEVWTEFFEPPTPRKQERAARVEMDPQRRRAMAEPDVVDETLDFDAMQIGPGRAFSVPEEDVEAGKDALAAQLVVTKRWLAVADHGRDRTFLVESLDHRDIKPRLSRLPKFGTLESSPRVRRRGTKDVFLPPPPDLDLPPTGTLEVAGTPYQPRGLVLDYVQVNSQANFTFASGTTYYVIGGVTLTGTTTIQGGAVVKYAAGVSITLRDAVVCQTSSGNPAYFVAATDNSVGETLTTGAPVGTFANPALNLYYANSGTTLSNLDIRNATKAIQDYSPYVTHTIQNCRLVDCDTGVWGYYTGLYLQNLTTCNVPTLTYDNGGASFSVNGTTTSCLYCPGDEHGNSISSATSVGSNANVAGTINCPRDEDFFRLTVGTATTLTIQTTGNTDTYGHLLNTTGNQLAYDDDSGDGYNFAFSQAVEPGAYYVRVRHYSQSSGTGSYTLVTSASFCSGDLHGNTLATATPVTLGVSVPAAIDCGGDEDFFRLSVPASMTLRLQSTGSTDTYAYLLDAGGNLLAFNDDNPYPNFRMDLPVNAGTYYARVRHYDPSSGTGVYTFLAENSAINNPPTISPLGSLTVARNAGAQIVYLNGITAGDGESQALNVTASSSDPGLIPTPNVTYTSPNPTGSLSFTPVANMSGTATVTVTVRDAGVNGTFFDGDDATTAVPLQVSVKCPPVLSLPGAPLAYTHAGADVVVDSGATVSDPDSPVFDGGKLTVEFSANGQADDRLAIRHQGATTGQIGLVGASVTFGGVVIGTWTGGLGTAPLVVNLNGQATVAAAEALVRNVTYANSFETPVTTSKELRWVLFDGGFDSPPAFKSVNLIPENLRVRITRPSSGSPLP